MAPGSRKTARKRQVVRSQAGGVHATVQEPRPATRDRATPARQSRGAASQGPRRPTRSTARQAFLERVVNYFTELADSAPEPVIAGALSEPTALATAARALAESVVEERALDEADRQIAAAVAAGARYKEDLLARAGGAYTAEQLGKILRISRQAVNDGRKTNLYFGVPAGQSYAYPKLQVTDSGIVNGLRSFLDAFTLPDPWMKLAVLVEPSERLDGRSPLDALRAGDIEHAVLVATTYGAHGA